MKANGELEISLFSLDAYMALGSQLHSLAASFSYKPRQASAWSPGKSPPLHERFS